ncbi:MAG TPA: hypothetical protein VKU19_40795 [Bryobacteraceae bacterium]|nr:hypothetical protein [Bryobacteraceae bacterium]
MNLRIVIAISLLPAAIAGDLSLHSELGQPGWLKVDHGYIIGFARVARETGHDAIEAFDGAGRRVLGVDVRGQIPEAAQITLYDVALRPGGPLVAGGVIRKTDNRLDAVLLYFKWDGALIRKIDLPVEQEINRLAIDEDGTVWTLADYSGRDDETRGPLVFQYDGTGQLLKGLLRRTDYRTGFQEGGSIGGVAGFGFTREGIWFWQPARHRMTIITRDGRVLSRVSIPLPDPRKDRNLHPPELDSIALLPSGQIAAGIGPDYVPIGAYLSNGKHFVRASSERLRLIGVDGEDFVFLKLYRPESGLLEIVRERVPHV